MEPSVIYEDNALIAVNKPSGLIVHPTGKNEEQTLTDWIIARYPKMEKVGEPLKLSSGETIHRAGIVHRLDKDTSGVIIFAKNQESFLFLKKQFQEHTIKKTYRAFVYGRLPENEGSIKKPIGRDRRGLLKSAATNARGRIREAVTDYKVLAKNKEFSYVDVFPRTGRTHQVRVHFKAIGHPIVCDPLYAPKRYCPRELGRLALHALSLEFKNQSGELLRIEAPLPADMEQALASIFPELSIA